jgi:hypothetical protein
VWGTKGTTAPVYAERFASGGPALRLHYTSTAKGSHAVDEQTTAVGDDERLHATSSLVFLDSCDKLGGEPEPCSTEAATIQSTSV